MSAYLKIPKDIEAERYELSALPEYFFATSRRDFFKFLGAGVLVVCALRGAEAQESGSARRHSDEEALPREISAWLHIGENDEVTVFTGKVEVGQNIRTSLSQAVAEELRVPVDSIQMIMGDTQVTPFDMGTFGSRTTPTMNLQLRRVAAAARDVLIGLAAAQWKADPADLTASAGKISDARTHRSAEYAELVRGQQLTEVLPVEDPLIPAAQWTVAGTSVPKVDGGDFVTGRHRYPYDQKLEGMLYGKVVRPDAFGATLVSMDSSEAQKIPGVTVVRDGNFVGVTAPSGAIASRAAAAVRAVWKSEPQPSSAELFEYLKKTAAEEAAKGQGEPPTTDSGDVAKAMAGAAHQMRQTFTVAYIAHAPLEPRAAIARWTGESLEVWTGTQRPFGVRGELAAAFHLPEERVRVRMPDTGSAYGGKHTGETAIEAARLAREVKRPVLVTWTREEEFTWAYFRPAGVIEVSGGADADGSIVAWEFHNYNSGEAGIRTFYEIPNQRIQFHPADSPLRQGSYRGLAATANHFARECAMDELAHLTKTDPLEFRMKNLKNQRLRDVFEAAAKQFDWGRAKTGEGRGFGIAGGFEKGGNVATCAEVEVDRAAGSVRVVRLVTAFECGAVVNPDNLKNQIEGANIMGIGGALFEAIAFENGRILNARFSKYRVPRFSDVPQVEAVLVDRKDIPSAGAGETPIVGVAPAIGNAIFDASGIRLRSLPMIPDGLKTT